MELCASSHVHDPISWRSDNSKVWQCQRGCSARSPWRLPRHGLVCSPRSARIEAQYLICYETSPDPLTIQPSIAVMMSCQSAVLTALSVLPFATITGSL